MIKSEDEKELASRYDVVSNFDRLKYITDILILQLTDKQAEVDKSDPIKMFEVLLHHTNHSTASSNVLSILHHCLLLPGNQQFYHLLR